MLKDAEQGAERIEGLGNHNPALNRERDLGWQVMFDYSPVPNAHSQLKYNVLPESRIFTTRREVRCGTWEIRPEEWCRNV
jgi:hypothetical protein